jgi:isopentenyldiphosphate isomerase
LTDPNRARPLAGKKIQSVDTSEHITSLRDQVNRVNYVLAPAVLDRIIRLAEACASNPAFLFALRQMAPEYARHEYLLNVNERAKPALPTTEMVADWRQVSAKVPGLCWFQESQIDGRPILLAARWLCHLAGLRHRTVQLFLDHPAAKDYTLIQVRGWDKAEAPGCFDLPCAGHVSGLETVDGALFKELEEELGLDRNDVSVPELLGTCEYRDAEGTPTLYNVEYRAVYRSRLRPGALSKIRFVDGEVGAVALFAVPEVQAMLDAVPERVASGLAGSWPLYLGRQE